MSHAVMFFIAVTAMLPAAAGFAEQLGRASYQDVCDKLEKEGVTSRTQTSELASEMGEEALGTALIVVGAGHRSGGRRSQTVSNSEILVSADLKKIATTTRTDTSHPSNVTTPQTERSSACD